MSIVPSILLVNVDSNEKHFLNSSEYIIGRGWLNCNDKRISRNHGILKINSPNSVTVTSAHQNCMFFRKETDTAVNQIEKNQDINLFVGDSFGLLVDEFWFTIQSLNNNVTNGQDENAVVQLNDVSPTANGLKRKSTEFEPDSTNKKVKTEPNEFEDNNGEGTNDNLNTTNEIPSTSASLPNTSQADVRNANDAIDQSINADVQDANDEQSIIAVKSEPLSDDENVGSTNAEGSVTVKTEVKDEPNDSDDNEASSSNAPVRPCCRYGMRCYRRNPAHRAEDAHPGDRDYRLPDYPPPPLGAPLCPFLDRCYRRNPTHFQQFSHKLPDQFKAKQKDGYEATAKPPKRTTATTTTTTNNQPTQNDPDDPESEDDPFASDGDSDEDYEGNGSSSSDDENIYDANTDEEEQE